MVTSRGGVGGREKALGSIAEGLSCHVAVREPGTRC